MVGSLQERLDKVFAALGPDGNQPREAWKPSAQQIFRSGSALDAPDVAASSEDDAEYEERQRRESMPGLAQSLVEEDEPDSDGFRPSTAFCRALDAEEEHDDIDEIATGLIARRQGGDALPPRDTQVLEDNIYEQRSRQVAALTGPTTLPPHLPDMPRQQQQQGQQQVQQGPTHMEVEEPAGGDVADGEAGAGAGTPPSAAAQQGAAAAVAPGRSALSSPRESSSGEAKEKKKVRFEGMAQPWVLPARRPGYQPRCTELPPDAADAQQGQQRGQQRQQRQGRGGISVVPEHVKHPEKFTCYVLDEPLVVGGGVSQLSRTSQQQDAPAAAVHGEEPAQAEAEPERWEGPVGVSAVQFKPRQPRGGTGGAEAAAAAGGKAGMAAKQQRPLAFLDDAEGVGMEEEGAAGGGAVADVPMREEGDAAKPRTKRNYRSSRTEEV